VSVSIIFIASISYDMRKNTEYFQALNQLDSAAVGKQRKQNPCLINKQKMIAGFYILPYHCRSAQFSHLVEGEIGYDFIEQAYGQATKNSQASFFNGSKAALSAHRRIDCQSRAHDAQLQILGTG
jgi:hypothetical protein